MELADLVDVIRQIDLTNNQLTNEWLAGSDIALCKELARKIEQAAGDLVEVFACVEQAVTRNTPSTEGDTA